MGANVVTRVREFLKRPRPLSFYLSALCVSLTVPILIVAAFMTWRFAYSEQLRLKGAVDDSAQQIVFAIERQLGADVAMLRALASSPALRYRDFEAFADQTRNLMGSDGQEISIVVDSADRSAVLLTIGKQVIDATELDTIYPYGSVSDFIRGASFEDSAYYVSVPVTVDGELRYWLHGRLSLARLGHLLESQNMRPGYFASIVDRSGIILARSSDVGKHYGRKLPGLDGPTRSYFTWSGKNPERVKVYGVFRRLPSGWGVTSGVSETLLNAPLHRSLTWLGLLAFVMAAVSALIAWALTRVMADAAFALTITADKLADGVDLVEPVTALVEVNTVGSAMVAASRKMRQQAEALEVAKDELEQRVDERTAELADKRLLLETTLANMDQALVVIDAAGTIRLTNMRAADMTGLSKELLDTHPNIADTVRLQIERGDFHGAVPEDVKIMFDRDKLRPGTTLVHEREIAGGRAMEIRTVPLPDGWLVRTYTDVTLRKHAERHLQHLARHDALTDLPNRVLFHERLEQALAYSERHQTAFAVLSLDLDRFKQINDMQGHAVGDVVLMELAKRLKIELRMEDTVARLGGDEFAVIQTGLTSADEPAALARRILRSVARPFRVDGTDYELGISVGIASCPLNGRTASDLMKKADAALYQAKRSGRNRFCSFEEAAALSAA
jgi:diguanylate cyclase (GGDEF)-like protein